MAQPVPPYQARAPKGEYAPTAYVRIAPDGSVTIACGKAEMGQGILTGFAQIVSDELDATSSSRLSNFAAMRAACSLSRHQLLDSAHPAPNQRQVLRPSRLAW